nr:branched-chain amino acid transport system II carrier protein [Bacillus sp. 7884-1]
MTVGLVGLFSLLEIINSTFLNDSFSELLSIVPLQYMDFGWVIPGLIGYKIGSIFVKTKFNEGTIEKKAA